MLLEKSNRAHVAKPAAAQLPKSPKTQAFEGVVMYYGYRFYDPETGRWPSRDPIGERGGVNLYGFGANDGVNDVDVLGMWYFEVHGEAPSYTQGNRTYSVKSFLGSPTSYFTDNKENLTNIIENAKKLGNIKDVDGNYCFDVVIDFRPLSISNLHGHAAGLTNPDDLFFFMTHGGDYKLVPEKRNKLALAEQYVWMLDGSIRTSYFKSLFKSKVMISACYHWPDRNGTVGNSTSWQESEKWLKEEFEKYSENCQKCERVRRIVIASGPLAQNLPSTLQKHIVNDKDSDPGVEYEGGK